MRNGYWLFVAALSLIAMGWSPASAKEEKAQADAKARAAAAEEDVQPASQPSDEDWLNTVWTQVDGMVQQEKYKLQKTVTVAAVRGAEAKNEVLEKLYYKGGKRYPSQDKLRKAIETLQKAVAQNPRAEEVPKQRFFIAQCYEKLGQVDEARTYYEQVIKTHPDTRWAQKSQERLAKLANAK